MTHAFLRDPRPRSFPSILGITPLEHPDARLVQALSRADALGVLDLGRDAGAARAALAVLGRDPPLADYGVRIPEGVVCDPASLPPGARVVVLTAGAHVEPWRTGFLARAVLVQVTSLAEAQVAAAGGARGLIVKGSESGGRVGDETAFVLLQRVVAAGLGIPIWVQGGVGLHTAAACVAGGARGVVLDIQLALVRESQLPEPVKAALRAMDGSETIVVGGHRVYTRPDLPVARLLPDTSADVVRARLGGDDLERSLLPVGQEAACARPFAERFRTASGVVHAVLRAIDEHLEAARRLAPLGPGSPLAADHGIRYPIAQGPMTRVSDRASFADAVSHAGGLPFLALSLMRGDEVRALLRETRALLGDRAWGVGILGFVPEELRDEQLAVLREMPPPAAIIAGGRPSQARPLDAQGTRTYLHVPSPGLLDLFLKDGARRFVFEGRECGGHVGPRSSFALWEAQIERLLAFEQPEELRVLFAGGIHDARSAAMVAALAAPLAARGAKIGVLMGTAYLFTEEAVASGAIQHGFQQAAIDCERTVLLETAPGHSTRCVESAYVRAFIAEKQRLEAEGLGAEEVWASLEQLNLGRLRIAAKGVKREGSSLVPVAEAEQRRDGMFMIGEVGALRGGITTMAELHREVSEGATVLLAGEGAHARHLLGRREPAPPPPPADVAVVGIACIFPDAPDRHAYWANIVGARSSITEVPAERWSADAYFEPGGSGTKTPSKWGGFLPVIAFDPLAYGIPPRSLAAIEPVQLLALDVARRALADAGYAERPFDRERTSVIFGAEAGTELSAAYGFRALYPQYAGPIPPALDEALPTLTEDSFPGVLANVIAGRIANRLDLGGVNYTVDAACAASLAAVDLAVKELVSGASDMVLCGGADVHNSINDYLLFASVHALSPTGACRTFADDADGIALGEGVACVVLKRLADAERDGDRVYAVIKGIAGSSDGRHLGLTAPRKEGQMRALARAYRAASVSPADVGLVEAHGTGTVVGDRTELATLTDVYAAAGARPGSVALGSVKSQIGHTKCAAGLAGLIKASLALHHRTLPPTLHIKRPNPAYDAAASPFVFGDVARPWPVEDRRAAVSAFGFGGANFHAVLAGYDAAGVPASGLEVWPAELFLFRARDVAGALAQMERLAAVLEADSESPFARRRLADLARTISERRGTVQIAIVAADADDLLEKLRLARSVVSEGAKPPSGVFVRQRAEAGKVAFLFPGQGSQRVGMLGEIFVAFPRLQRFLTLGETWARRIFPPMAQTPADRAAQTAALTDTRVAQPALGIAGLAMAELLGTLGVKADLAGGHSYGELVALAYAGVIPERDLLPISAMRGEVILEAAGADPGTMAAVTASVAEVERHLVGLDVEIANENAPDQTVISGPTAGVDAAVARLEAAGIAARSIPVACAFHSRLVASAQATFGAKLPNTFGAPRIPVWSNYAAQPYPDEEPSALRKMLVVQIANRVRFREEIESMYEAGARTFVEVGPGRVLTGLVGKILGARPHVAVACDRSGESGIHRLLSTLAELAVSGVPVDPAALFAGREARVFDIDDPPSAAPPASAWLVNGHLARPLSGEIPRGGLRPIPEPVVVQAAMAPAGADESAVIEYLRTTRAMIEAQRQVMLGYLGHAGLSAAEGLAPPVTLPAIPSLAPPRPVPSLAPPRAPSLAPSRGSMVPTRPRPSLRPVQASASIAPRAARLPSESAAWMHEIEATAGVPRDAPVASVRDMLLEIVSERTGYPADMLDLDLNLEAELSIDSIKRIEILGTLGQRLGLDAELGEKRDRVIEQLATKKTLRGIVEWLETRGDGPVATTRSADMPREKNGAAAHEPAPPALPMGDAPALPGLRRYQIAVEDTLPEPRAALSGKVFAIVPDGTGIAAELVALLAERGAGARIVGADEPVEGVHGLVYLASFAAQDPAAATKDLFEAARRAIAAGASRLLAFTQLGAPFAPEGDLPRAGVAGLLRSLAKEMPHLVVRSVSLDPREGASVLADRVATELALADHDGAHARAHGDPIEVAWVGGARRALAAVVAGRAQASSAPRLDASSVVLVTGGARGITATSALALARRTGCLLELVGRTPMPDRPEDPDLAGAADLPALRRAILARGLPKSLGDVESLAAEVMAARAIRATLAAAGAAGLRVRYRALDVRDEAALGALIDALYTEHGRLDGVVHGAGVLEDKLFLHKTRESFDRVFDTKVSGARAIAKHVRPDVGFVAFFGSVAGAFGNRGQVDYAAANDALDKLAWWLASRVRGRVVSIDWGPWAGTGMVSPELAREYARVGVGLVDPEAGAEAFVDEVLSASGPAQVVLMNATAEVMLQRSPGAPAEESGKARASAPAPIEAVPAPVAVP